jgi:soluble lytic murein transglycosylase-like protein
MRRLPGETGWGGIAAMILAIASSAGVPPYFALSVALTENPALDPLAVHVNENGSRDLGVMQLNDSWFTGDWQDPETNIRDGCELIRWLMRQPGITTYWDVALTYNCGYYRFMAGPPMVSVEYACRVYEKWNAYRGYRW